MPETLPQLSPEFRDFLIEAKSEHGYGQPGVNDNDSESGGKRIVYERDEFVYVDSFEGGSPYGGHESVSVRLDGKLIPVWNMVYRETLNSAPGEEISVLRKVLAQPDPELPVRGPKNWSEDDTSYAYRKVTRGSALEDFDVEEFIHVGGKHMYVARFMGGLVNRSTLLESTNPVWLVHG